MRLIEKNFESNMESMSELIKASNANEDVLYDGIKCKVTIEPSISSDVSPKWCYVTSSTGRKNSYNTTKGLLYWTQYQLALLYEKYTLGLCFDENGKEIFTTINMEIQSISFQKIKDLTQSNTQSSELEEYLEENSTKTTGYCVLS